MIKRDLFLALTLPAMCVFAGNQSLTQYTEHNQAIVSFDVSMPIDATGYILQGNNLTGGCIRFSNGGIYIAPLLAHETGEFQTPNVTNLKNKPLIKTKIKYNAIKFINPNGIDNIFIKIGTATRTQTVAGLDPFVLKDGTYTWEVPIFSFGKESDTVDHKSSNFQFIEVGSNPSYPAKTNAMYTQQFFLYSRGKGDAAIVGHPIASPNFDHALPEPYTDQYTCHADGMWGSGGDPYRTTKGGCEGYSTTFPAGPNLDYEYGAFKLPTVYSPWKALPSDHCVFPGHKKRKGCTNISIMTNFRYSAQKISVPINKSISVFAAFGTAYRSIKPKNLRYQCKSNVYLKNILPPLDCMVKSYLPGGASYTYFSVGYEFKDKNGIRYTARYMNIPEAENQNRLQWRDASTTEVYAISSSKKEPIKVIKENLTMALNTIREENKPLYNVLGKRFFIKMLNKNTS